MKPINHKQLFQNRLLDYMRTHDLKTSKDFSNVIAQEGLILSDRTINSWLSGEKCPNNIETLLTLCKILGITLNDLFSNEIKEFNEQNGMKTACLSQKSKELLKTLLENKLTVYYKTLATETDLTVNFKKHLTYAQASQEYERNLENAFIREQLYNFLALDPKKQTPDELFNYINVEINPDERMQLYPYDNKNVLTYAMVETQNYPENFEFFFESGENEQKIIQPEHDIAFDFLNIQLPSTEQQKVLETLTNDLDETLESVFGELFGANVLMRNNVKKSLTQFVDIDNEDQRVELCVMNFIRVEFSVQLTKEEIEYFLKTF